MKLHAPCRAEQGFLLVDGCRHGEAYPGELPYILVSELDDIGTLLIIPDHYEN